MATPMNLAEQLRKLIRDDSRSMTALEHDAEIPSGVLSRFVRGHRDMQLAYAGRLCAVFGVELRSVRPAGRPRRRATAAR